MNVATLLAAMPLPVPAILDHAGRPRRPRAAGSRRRDAAGASRRGVAGRARGALSPGGLVHRDAAAARRRAGVADVSAVRHRVRRREAARGSWSSSPSTSSKAIAARSSPSATGRALRAEWAAIAEELAAEPRVLCHRDYHSRNLMLHDGSLYIIDFQDARMGPDTYDLVSLLRDSYVDIADDASRRADRVLPRAQARRVTGRPARVPPPVRPDGAAAQSEGARHVRLPDDHARQPGLHPVHPAHAALRARRTWSSTRASRACASCSAGTSRNCARAHRE